MSSTTSIPFSSLPLGFNNNGRYSVILQVINQCLLSVLYPRLLNAQRYLTSSISAKPRCRSPRPILGMRSNDAKFSSPLILTKTWGTTTIPTSYPSWDFSSQDPNGPASAEINESISFFLLQTPDFFPSYCVLWVGACGGHVIWLHVSYSQRHGVIGV